MYSMGTRLDMLLPGTEDEIADRVFYIISEEVERLEAVLSIYRENSVFSILNRNAAKHPVHVEIEVMNLFSQLFRFNVLTLGYFDIALGTARKAAEQDEIYTSDHPGFVLDESAMTVGFDTSDIRIDSGAFGKGLALKSIKKILLEAKIYNAFISFGDSSVLTLGHHPFGDHWKVGINDLFSVGRNVFVFDITDGSISTSGNSPNNEKKYPEGHIVNPLNGETVKGYTLMCVAGPDPLEAEVISTALLAADRDLQLSILSNFPGYRAVMIDYSNNPDKPAVTELKPQK